MKRIFGIAAVFTASWGLTFGQGYQPVPYAPRQAYPARPLTPYRNPALTNNPYNYQRPGLPAVQPFPTNYPAGNRFAPNPYSFTNVMPRAGYDTNAARFAPARPNLPGYATTRTNFFLTNGPGGNNAFVSRPGATNLLLPNSTNSQSRAALTPAQRQNIDRLTGVFHAIKNPPVSLAQRDQILSTLRASIRGTPRPSDEAVAKLVDDLAAAWPSKTFTFQQKFQLAVDLNRVVTSGNLTEGEVLVVVNDARRVLQQVGVSVESRNALIDDLTAIAAQVQKPTPKVAVAVPEVDK